MKYGINIGRIYGAPIYVNFSVVAILLFFTKLDNLFYLSPFILFAYLLLILVHEFGHAFFINKAGYEINSIAVYALLGECRYQAEEDDQYNLLIASGGILFQIIFLFFCFLISHISISIDNTYLEQVFNIMIFIGIPVNLTLIFINLMPLRGLDGHIIWTVIYKKLKTRIQRIIIALKNKRVNRKIPNQDAREIAYQAMKKAARNAHKN